ncbi:UNVERIFIED_ORG: hypothetical protein ABIC97_004069 [Peribacillus simplex]
MTGEMLIQDELLMKQFFEEKSSHQREWQVAQLIGNEYTNHVYQSLHEVHER